MLPRTASAKESRSSCSTQRSEHCISSASARKCSSSSPHGMNMARRQSFTPMWNDRREPSSRMFATALFMMPPSHQPSSLTWVSGRCEVSVAVVGLVKEMGTHCGWCLRALQSSAREGADAFRRFPPDHWLLGRTSPGPLDTFA